MKNGPFTLVSCVIRNNLEKSGAMDESERKYRLSGIMEKVDALADVAWPRDACGVSAMPEEELRAIIEIQEQAAKALGLPEDLPLMTGAASDITET